MKKFRSSLVVAALAALLAIGVAACGSGDDTTGGDSSVASTPAVACNGEPVVVANIASLAGPTPKPEITGGVEAAAEAINHNCSAGRPIELVTCNDEGDPSIAADCGRKVVSSGAVALVGAAGVATGSFEPIVQGEGIASIGNFATDITELAATTSFPFYNGIARIAARASLHAAAGAKSVAIILPENPALNTLKGTMEEVCESFGIEVERFVPVPIDATDVAQYASQAGEAESIMILMDSKAEGLLHELVNAAVTPAEKVISSPYLSQEEVDEFGGGLDGLLISAPTVPLNEESNEGVEQYMTETEAVGVDDHGVEGMVAWRAMHVVAELIKKLPNPTPASLIKAVEAYSFAPPEAAPVDFTKPAFPEIPVFEGFRIFSREYAAWKIEDGEITLAVPDFVDPESRYSLD